ncbi:MAG: adenosine kinase [Opitutales bacterium]|jgi:sugar/nucleoside kinase (ribokinase family)|nr:adenosine kinase [Opitutales bacterium]MBT5814930.1 adenosine kinase [Opitutales bacterium]MBT6379246.1 adenosine kinase [Opitutales bacterium]MBT6770686.1 adenosine kinase [Opitutales bacterium]MBT7865999.1 adenosine kinase [Opitutales bacterium]
MPKKYHVYGMGNALVDIVTEVSDAFVNEHAIEKGLMTLVDEERQHQLVNAIYLPGSDRQCGGSAANTIIGAAQFGASCFYSCKVANDEMGDFYHQDLTSNGVSTNLSPGNHEEGITGKCLVMTTPDAERTMNTFLGITATYSPNEICEVSLKESEYLYIEGYLVTGDSSCEAMKTAKSLAEANGVKTALTFSDPSMVKYFKEPMTQVVGSGVDLLFCNEEEAMLFTDTETIASAKEALKSVARTFVITLGARGALLFDGQNEVQIAPFPTNAVDTNGAGDLFAGAFLYGITHGKSFAEAGKLASLASSRVVAKFGPRLSANQAKETHYQLFA